MPSAQVKAALAGLGVMGSYHLRVLTSLPDVELVAVADPSAEHRARATVSAPQAATFATLREALDATQPDIVCLAAPPEVLPALAREAIDARVAMLIEKPMAASEEEAVAVVTAAEDAGVLLTVGHVERFNPAVIALTERIRGGKGGRVYQIHARRLSPYPARQSKQGVALDLATHDIDVIRAVTDSEIGRVHAETARRADSGPEDLVSASLRLESGATGVLETNWLTPAKVRELTVTAEDGMFVVNYLTQDLTFYENPRANIEWDAIAVLRGTGEGDVTRYALERREPLRVQWESVLAALRDGTPPAISGWDGVAAMSTARAIQRSGETGEPQVPGYRALDALARART